MPRFDVVYRAFASFDIPKDIAKEIRKGKFSYGIKWNTIHIYDNNDVELMKIDGSEPDLDCKRPDGEPEWEEDYEFSDDETDASSTSSTSSEEEEEEEEEEGAEAFAEMIRNTQNEGCNTDDESNPDICDHHKKYGGRGKPVCEMADPPRPPCGSPNLLTVIDDEAKCWYCNARGCDLVEGANHYHYSCHHPPVEVAPLPVPKQRVPIKEIVAKSKAIRLAEGDPNGTPQNITLPQRLYDEWKKVCDKCKGNAGLYGNNPKPLKYETVCDECNYRFVIPCRLELFQKMEHLDKSCCHSDSVKASMKAEITEDTIQKYMRSH